MRKIRRWLLLTAVLAGLLLWFLALRGPKIEQGSLLVVELEGAYVEASAPSLLGRLLGSAPRPLVGQLSELAKAERDDRIATVLLRIGSLDVGWGKAQELRSAIQRLGARGRHTIAYLELEKFGANLEYYVASAAQEVYMAPAARNPLVGLAGEYLFLGGFFEKLGVKLEYERVGRYKSAVESFAETQMSDANREMTNALLDSLESQLLKDIGASRGLDPEQVREAIDAAPASPAEMQARGLIDGMAFRDELIEKQGAPPVVEASDYARVDAASVGFDPVAQVALIYGTGMVVTGEGSVTPRGNPVLASDTVVEAIEDAADDPEIEALLLRIDSPGGSALASDLVWRATQRARRKGKPVVASFSDVAASGGYYVACGADRVVAEPASFTGSIGVFVLRPVLGGLFDKLGIGVETLTRGDHADLLLASRPLTPGTRERLRADVQNVYELFVARVAEGRGLEAEQVDALGRGRVYTGAQAAEAGLVDVLGGLRDAVLEVKRALDLDPEADVALVPYPPPRPLAEQVRELFQASLRSALGELPGASRALELLALLSELPSGAPVLLPPVLPEIR